MCVLGRWGYSINTTETQATFTLTLSHTEASAQVGIDAVGSVRIE